MSRSRRALALALAGIALACGRPAGLRTLATEPAETAAAGLPNVVLIIADDMRWDAMGCAGNPLLETPCLDRLAREGTRFSNAFVTTPICATSRASILTGQYARRHGVHDFTTPLRDSTATYPVMLRAAGYVTGFIGKWGIDAEDRREFVDWSRRFDFWAGDMQQTVYWHGRDCAWLGNDGTAARDRCFCDCPADARRSEGVRDAGPHPALRAPVHAETEFMPAKIRSFLEQRDPRRPFCLTVCLKAPHAPWGGFAPRFAASFADKAIPRVPSISAAEARRLPLFLQRSLGSERGLRFATDAGLDGTRDRALRQYYRLVAGVDFCVGRILAELDDRGLAGNTVVLFTSDNGMFTGEHGLSGKWLLYEESIRVPLLVRDPRLPAAAQGRVCSALALNIDLHPTCLELAGVPVPPGVQGQSLLPLLHDPARPFRDGFFLEHLFANESDPHRRIERSEGYRTAAEKYILYIDQQGSDSEELYGLRDDPFEMRNRSRDAAAEPLLERLRVAHRTARERLP